MTTFTDTVGDDTFTGGADDDVFNMFQGGADTVEGKGGSDSFYFGGTFGAGDHVDGGNDYGRLYLDGDYSDLSITTDMLVDVLSIDLAAGGTYNITVADGVAAPDNAGLSFAAHGFVTIDVSAEVDSRTFLAADPAGFDYTGGGAEDDVNITTPMLAGDRFDGRGGDDLLGIRNGGVYRFSNDNLTDVEYIVATSSARAARLVMANGNVAAGESMYFVNLGGTGWRVDGHREKDGTLVLSGSFAAADTLIGGRGADTLQGHGHADVLTGGKGADLIDLGSGSTGDATVFINSRMESGLGHADTIKGAADGDVIDLSHIDADKRAAGNQAFTLVVAFTGARGEAMISYDKDTGNTTLLLETNGRPGAELEIILRAADFDPVHDYTGFGGFVF